MGRRRLSAPVQTTGGWEVQMAAEQPGGSGDVPATVQVADGGPVDPSEAVCQRGTGKTDGLGFWEEQRCLNH